MEVFMKAFLEYVCEATNQDYGLFNFSKGVGVLKIIILYDTTICDIFTNLEKFKMRTRNEMSSRLKNFFTLTVFYPYFYTTWRFS